MRVKVKSVKKMCLPFKICMNFNTGLKKFQSEILKMRVRIRPNYYDGFGQSLNFDKSMTLKQYYKSDLPTNLMCPEDILQPKVIDLITVDIPTQNKNIDYAVTLVHAGKKGSLSPLHFDWDFSFILHTCITGIKDFYFFPPESSWLLDPILNTSAIDFARLSKKDKDHLTKRLGGFKLTIRPGEAVQFPSLWWHCVDYIEDSIGLSIRVENNENLRPFAVLPRNWRLQRLIWERSFVDKNFDHTDLLGRVLPMLLSKEIWIERYKHLNALYKESPNQTGREFGYKHFKLDNFNSELCLAKDELKETFDLSSLEKTRTDFQDKLDTVETIKKFIFASHNKKTYTHIQNSLTYYAINKLKGLPPKLGIIKI